MNPMYYRIVIYDNYSKEDKENITRLCVNTSCIYFSQEDSPTILERVIANRNDEYLEPRFFNAFVHSDYLEDAKKEMKEFNIRYKILDNDIQY